MRGMMFLEFFNTVENVFGGAMVDKIIDSVEDELSTGGAYTSVGNYPHDEMLAMATALSTLSGTEMPHIIEAFAAHLMGVFFRMHPEQFERADGLFEFLLSVDQQIHVDVRKLYPDANPPLIVGEIQEDNSLLLKYESKRPFAELACALVKESAKHYGEDIVMKTVTRSEDDKKVTMIVRPS